MEQKFILKSMTVWGAIVLVLGALHIQVPFTNEEVSQVINAVGIIVGFVLTIKGRMNATQPLGWVPKR